MREILFRGKRLDNGKWIEGYFTRENGGCCSGTPIIETRDDDYEVYPNTVGQFTGMLDANGKKIFDGDIIRLCADVKKTFDVDDGDVRYSRGGFFVGSYGNTLKSLNTLADYTGVMRGVVIGNIHDNPELMKEGELNGN